MNPPTKVIVDEYQSFSFWLALMSIVAALNPPDWRGLMYACILLSAIFQGIASYVRTRNE